MIKSVLAAAVLLATFDLAPARAEDEAPTPAPSLQDHQTMRKQTTDLKRKQQHQDIQRKATSR